MYRKVNTFLAAAVLYWVAQGASATTLSLDYASFLTPGCTTSCDIGHSVSVGGLTASAYYYDGHAWQNADLWVRNEGSNDQGFGVCSTGEACGTQGQPGSGDANELSQGTHQEVIVLTRPAGYSWSDLVVSSLDSGGTNGAEAGTMFWSGTDVTAMNGSQVSDFLNGTVTGTNPPNQFSFSYGTGGNAANQVDGHGSVVGLSGAGGFDHNANTLVFTSGRGSQISSGLLGTGAGQSCTGYYPNKTCTTIPLNNDYLVGGALLASIPEPDTLALMGLGLAGLMFGRGRLQKPL